MKSNFSTKQTIVFAASITLCVFIFYFLTLAPTVLWGDDAQLQRQAILKASDSGIRNYWLWISIVHEFTKLPIGDIAWRVNLSSAVFAAMTVGIVFVILYRILEYPVVVSGIVSMALAISHTFWMHAVRAEIYSFFLFVFAIIVALLLAWHKNTNRWLLLCVSLVLLGLTFSIHLLVATLIPAVISLVICAKNKNGKWIYIMAVLSVFIGLIPYLILSQSASTQFDIFEKLSKILQFRIRNLVLWPAFLSYQFMLLTPFGILGLVDFYRSNHTLFLFLVIAFLGNVVFAMFYNVPDQYVFYLPSYLIFVLWIGNGLSVLYRLINLLNYKYVIVVLIAIALIPVPIYRLTPIILNKLNINLLSVRTLPYRDNNLFFLFPAKNEYYGAHDFGESVMKMLPPNAAILADWLPQQTLLYFQEVKKMRQDILIAGTYIQEGQLTWLIEQSQKRPVFIADNDNHYDLVGINRIFNFIPFGPIFLLQRKP